MRLSTPHMNFRDHQLNQRPRGVSSTSPFPVGGEGQGEDCGPGEGTLG